MTEGEKHCGLVSLLPMSCRGRAEAFARRLHNRLRSLGSQDIDVTSETNWLANNEIPIAVTNLQPRHATENDIFIDFGLFDTPGSPEEEIVDPELAKIITNPKDDLHHLNLDECACISGDSSFHIVKKNSLESDSSDGVCYDPENVVLESSNCVVNNHVNGISHPDEIDERVCPKDELPSDPPTSTVSTLSQEEIQESSKECTEEERLNRQVTSGWCLNYEPKKINSSNNNVYSAIDLESLKRNSSIGSSQEEISSNDEDVSSNESKSESYCSLLNIQQDLTIECPTVNCFTNPVVEVSTLEIIDTHEKAESLSSSVNLELNGRKEETLDINHHLQVQSLVSESDNTDDSEIEERLPRVRRCSSLKTGKTPPGTPGRKKIVRFADVLGLDLADVRTFMDEIPKIPISAYDDLSGAELTLSDNSLCSNSSALDSIHSSSKTVVPLFQQPGGEANFMEKIKKNHVCLENAILKDSTILCISGTVRVRNLDFNKSVHIRYSIDGWKSYSDMQATYVENSCDGFSDKFSFTLYVHTLTIGQRLEFAVRFQCRGCQYWDNNADVNYVFHCLPTSTTTSYVPITTPDENNWAGASFY